MFKFADFAGAPTGNTLFVSAFFFIEGILIFGIIVNYV